MLKPTVIFFTVILHVQLSQCAPPYLMDNAHPVPEDVTRFHNFVEEFERGEVRLVPTAQLLRGQFPLAFETNHRHVHHHIQTANRLKRDTGDVLEPTEPGLTEYQQRQQQQRSSSSVSTSTQADDEDTNVRLYVRHEINRIFNCYQRLRCGFTRAQAEDDCKWLETSSLYHQLMKMLGIKNYPKKVTSSIPQGPASHTHSHSHSPVRRTQPNNNGGSQPAVPVASARSSPSSQNFNADVEISPLHQNLQNGIRYGGARPGHYLNQPTRNRRYYDSFYTKQELAPISGKSSKSQTTTTTTTTVEPESA